MSIGERLKLERERLGLTIQEVAEASGAKKNTVIDWQKDISSPPAAKLAALVETGVDVLYVLTGQRSAQALSADEQELLALFRAASLAGKAAAIGALQGVAGAAAGVSNAAGVRISAKGGNAAGGNITIGGKKQG